MGQIPRSVERISSFIYFTPSSFIHYVSIPLDLINVLSCFQDFLIFTRFEGFLTFLIFVTFFYIYGVHRMLPFTTGLCECMHVCIGIPILAVLGFRHHLSAENFVWGKIIQR